MKNYFPFLFLFLLVLSCTKYQSEILKFISSDGVNEISVSATQSAPMDPLKVTVKVKVPKGEKTFFVELSASKLNTDNVKMEWLTNNKGTLTLTHADGQKKVMNVNLNDDKIHVIQEIQNPH